MGKKSKRNREASKKQQSARVQQGRVTNTSTTNDVAAAVVGNEIELSTSARILGDTIDSLGQLVEKGDHGGIITHESNLVCLATALEGTEPEEASCIYLMLAEAFDVTGCSSMIAREKSIRYLERSFALSDKEIILQACVRQLMPLYLQEGRHDRAFGVFKRLTGRIPQQELIDPGLILSLAQGLHVASLNEKVIEILSMFLGTINRSWDKDMRAAAYLVFGEGYTALNEYEKAASFLQKALTTTDDLDLKVAVLCQMGTMSRFSCNYDDSLATLNQAVEILSAESGERREKSKSWSKLTILVHSNIGDVLSEQGKCDLEALESFERALVILKEEDRGGDTTRKLALLYQGIGLVHARLGNWDEAIDFLKLAHSTIGKSAEIIDSHLQPNFCKDIGRVRLDQYFWDERLRQNAQERENILMEAATFSQESIKFHWSYSNNAILNYAQVAYFKAEIGEANKFLMAYFEAEIQMEKNFGISCRSCKRKAGNGTDIKICRNCQVVNYCCEAHQALAWRRGRLSHKVMCPFLKRYRLVTKAKNRIDIESFEDICKDFFKTVCVLKYEV